MRKCTEEREVKHTWAGVEGLWVRRKCFEGAGAGDGEGLRRVRERKHQAGQYGWVVAKLIATTYKNIKLKILLRLG